MSSRARVTLVATVVALGVVAAACGSDSSADHGAVEIEMVDIGFEPESLEIARGETVTFRFVNTGEAVHDAFIGDRAAQDDHEIEMRARDDEHGHPASDDDAVTVEPGDDATLEYTFAEAGTFEIGCHQVGHYAAGMKVTITVA